MTDASIVTVGIPTRNRPEWLREAMQSVLDQTYSSFRLLIADNASTDETREVVESFGDDRITYDRSPTDVGMSRNHNRIVAATTTPYLAILPDDDLFYPDFLERSLMLIQQEPTVGVVHCAFDLIGRDGELLRESVRVGPCTGPVTRESGSALIARAMRSSGLVCATSALFRTEAIAVAGGVRPEDEPYADGPLMMRIGLRHDFLAQEQAHVAVRVHGEAASATAGDFTGVGYAFDDSLVRHLNDQRLLFLAESQLPAEDRRRYRSIAARALRADTVGLLTKNVASSGERRKNVARFKDLVREDPRALLDPASVKFLATVAGGRTAMRLLSR